MASLNEVKYAALETLNGVSDLSLNGQEYLWLFNQTAQPGLSLNGQWMYLLASLGFTNQKLNERQLASWIDLGAPAGSTWNEAAFWFWENGGQYVTTTYNVINGLDNVINGLDNVVYT